MGLVDGELHFHHFSRGLLFFFVVFVPVVFEVTELAINAEGAGNELHRGDQLVGGNVLEDLNVLELLGGGFRDGRFLSQSEDRVREKGTGEKNSYPAKVRRQNGIHPCAPVNRKERLCRKFGIVQDRSQ
jgi:hypothetical protein